MYEEYRRNHGPPEVKKLIIFYVSKLLFIKYVYKAGRFEICPKSSFLFKALFRSAKKTGLFVKKLSYN